MTVELVTGHIGTGHIGSDDVGGLISGMVGQGDYVIPEPYGNLPCTVDDSNHVTIGRGDAIMGGRHVRVEQAEQLTVTSGSQQSERHDLVCLHYSKDSAGTESASLRVIRGTTGSASTPSYETGLIQDSAAQHDMPLYRLDLDGITLSTTPVQMFTLLTPVSSVTSAIPLPTRPANSIDKTYVDACVIPYPGGKEGWLIAQYKWIPRNATAWKAYENKNVATFDGWKFTTENFGTMMTNMDTGSGFAHYAYGYNSTLAFRHNTGASYPGGAIIAGMVSGHVVRA